MEDCCVIKSCSCKHPEQDKIYGVGKRLFNPCRRKESARGRFPVLYGHRCTVCGRVEILPIVIKK